MKDGSRYGLRDEMAIENPYRHARLEIRRDLTLVKTGDGGSRGMAQECRVEDTGFCRWSLKWLC